MEEVGAHFLSQSANSKHASATEKQWSARQFFISRFTMGGTATSQPTDAAQPKHTLNIESFHVER